MRMMLPNSGACDIGACDMVVIVPQLAQDIDESEPSSTRTMRMQAAEHEPR